MNDLVLKEMPETHFSNGIIKINGGKIIDDLPLSHNCNFNHFEGMLSRGILEAKECEIFENEKLVYFFYGRPNYMNEKFRHPVFLLFELTDNIEGEHRILPFDSGAYFNGYLDGNKKTSLSDANTANSIKEFYVDSKNGFNTIDYSKNIIRYFFGDNDSYFSNDPIDYNIYNASCQHYETINKQFSPIVDNKTDIRASTIEIQVKSDFCLKKNKILYANVPKEFLGKYSSKVKEINPSAKVTAYTPGQHNRGMKWLMGHVEADIKLFLKDRLCSKQ